MHCVTVATCSLNQWALDFTGNTERILHSIEIAAEEHNATYRLGPELEITGYGCGDHYFEMDTYRHSWECLARILQNASTRPNMVIDVGMPVMHKSVKYNCRVIMANKEIVLIRPKVALASDGNYREARWFAPWQRAQQTEKFTLPDVVRSLFGQATAPIGDAVLVTKDGTTFGTEMCEELFTSDPPNVNMALDGVDIFTNGSGSHHQLRKLARRIHLMRHATIQGGVYLYANQQGCDGDRLYYDGCAVIFQNGNLVASGTQFSLKDIEVVSATVDIEKVRSARGALQSRNWQAAASRATYPRVHVNIDCHDRQAELLASPITHDDQVASADPSSFGYPNGYEEIALGPACWLWDYLRRSGLRGYFLPLSGGIDSCATLIICAVMCRLLYDAFQEHLQDDTRAARHSKIQSDLRRVLGEADTYRPSSPEEIANRLLYTAFMGTEHSSGETRQRAEKLAKLVGSYHVAFTIDSVLNAIMALITTVTMLHLKFTSQGGSNIENLALQNIQARLRMLIAYLFAAILPLVRSKENHAKGSLLVLGSANVDESLRGYFTKYDCSSADLNPIGAISKKDLRGFIGDIREKWDWPLLDEFLDATPTAELEPTTKEYVQSDEIDMGMTYEELTRFGKLRKEDRCGPYSMFMTLAHEWRDKMSLQDVAAKVKRFFYYYSINRHKMTTLTPSYHAEQYSPDDNRFDERPFLYNAAWTHQFNAIDEAVAKMEAARKQQSAVHAKK